MALNAQVARSAPLSRRCYPDCDYGYPLHAHHDRLLSVEKDADELLDLMELAVTWGELDYSGMAVIPPRQWLAFAEHHTWRNRDRVVRIFALATDIARRSGITAEDAPIEDPGATLLRVVEV